MNDSLFTMSSNGETIIGLTIEDIFYGFEDTDARGFLDSLKRQKIDDVILDGNLLKLIANSETLKTLELPTSSDGLTVEDYVLESIYNNKMEIIDSKTSSLDNSKIDDIIINGNILSLYANSTRIKSITLPTSSSTSQPVAIDLSNVYTKEQINNMLNFLSSKRILWVGDDFISRLGDMFGAGLNVNSSNIALSGASFVSAPANCITNIFLNYSITRDITVFDYIVLDGGVLDIFNEGEDIPLGNFMGIDAPINSDTIIGQLQRILNKLREKNMLNNTIYLFTGFKGLGTDDIANYNLFKSSLVEVFKTYGVSYFDIDELYTSSQCSDDRGCFPSDIAITTSIIPEFKTQLRYLDIKSNLMLGKLQIADGNTVIGANYYTSEEIDEKFLEVNNLKFDNVSIDGTLLRFGANGVVVKTVTIPTTVGGYTDLSNYVTKDELNGMEIGGSNYLNDTKSRIQVTGSNTVAQLSKLYNMSGIPSDIAGKKMTLSFIYTVTGYQGGGFLIQSGPTKNVVFGDGIIVPIGNGVFRYKYTKQVPQGFNTENAIYISLENFIGNIAITEMKLELGDKATGWSPSAYDVDANFSAVSQQANKISWLISSDSTQSSLTLTQQLLSAMAQDIRLSADNISLEGYTTINNKFRVLEDGSIEVEDGTFSGNITAHTFVGANETFRVLSDGTVECVALSRMNEIEAATLIVDEIENSNYQKSITSNMTIYINSSIEIEESSSEFINGARFKTIEAFKSVCFRNLNGYTLTIIFEADYPNNVAIDFLVNGKVYIHMKTHTIFGYLYLSQDVKFNIYGNDEDNIASNDANIGYIKPASGKIGLDSIPFNIYISGSDVKLYNIDIYKTPEATSSGIYAVNFANIIISNTRFCNNPHRGILVSNVSTAYINSSGGTTTDFTYVAAGGSTIYINPTEQAGRLDSSEATKEYGNSKIYAEGATLGNSSVTGTGNTGSSTVPVEKVAILRSTDGHTYRKTVYNNWKSDSTVRQGEWNDGSTYYGDCVGIWVFGSSFAQYVDKNIAKIELTVTRNSGGYSTAVQHVLRTHNHASKPSGAPSFSTWSKTFSLATGNSTTISLTSSADIAAFKAAKGFGLDPQTYNRNNYSVCSKSMTVKITYLE